MGHAYGVLKCHICGSKVFLDDYDNKWSHYSVVREEDHNAEVNDEDWTKE